ncbi:hypothetical protein [Haloplanus natans]|uniref:hypothetical protein n=1 Tax=Haloplanus natans TaxID=376171 RepID=UPI000677D154|nr:hypothetical protein [Haloplanus natans]
MTRRSEREIERVVDELAGASPDPDPGRPTEQPLDEDTRKLLDDLTTIDDADDVYGETDPRIKRLHKQSQGETP